MIKKNGVNQRFAILLLVGFFVYAFLVIFLVENNDKSIRHLRFVANTGLIQVDTNLEYRAVSEPQEITSVEEVQGLKDFIMGSCDARFKIAEPQLFCGSTGSSGDFEIKMAEIFAPDVLFAGAATPFDDLVLTSNPSARVAFRNAAEMINPESDYLINMPPLPEFQKNLLSKEEKQEPFEMHYETLGQIDKIEFDDLEKSLCPKVVNGGEFNVKAANKLQKDLTGSVTPPGIMELGSRDIAARLCREDVRTIHLDEDESFLLCSEGFWAKLKCAKITSLFGDQCEDIQGIVIDAPLGSGERCNEEDCAIRYTEAGRLLTSPPIWTDDLYPATLTKEEKEGDYIVDDPVILTTPCKVRVNCQICETKCIWDLSMWQHTYDLEKVYTYPGYENAMDEDEYWDGVEHELRMRGVIGTSKF